MKRIILQGKAWEIRYLLNQYAKKFTYVREWIHANETNCSNRAIPQNRLIRLK